MNSTENLKNKARFLRNAAPQQFTDFYGAFAEYAEAAAEIMVMTTENIQLYQGHAQQCVKILKALEDAKNG
jgi:hypothetical protein